MDAKITKGKAKGERLVSVVQAAQATGKPGAEAAKGLQDRASRTVAITRALGPLFEAVKRRAEEESTKGATPGGAKLAGLVKRPTQGVRPNGQGGRQVYPGIARSVVMRNLDGAIVQRIPRFNRNRTEAEVSTTNQAIRRMAAVDAPVAVGTVLHEVPSAEHEYVDSKRGRVVRAVGSMLLDTLSTGAGNHLKGTRVGLYMISPSALGGRLALLAKTFEQHKAIKCTVIYAPVVPSTTTGAFMMYAQNDVQAPSVDIGTDELRHASTHQDWCQVAVWRQATMDINPSNINLRYFDSEENPIDSIQSILQVECADNMNADTDYGNLFLHYDFEFYSEALDYSEGQQTELEVSLVLDNYTVVADEAVAASFYSASAASEKRFVPSASSVFPDTPNQVLYGVVTEISGGVVYVYSPTSANLVPLVAGQGFYIGTGTNTPGSNDWENGTVAGVLFYQFPDGFTQSCLFANPAAPLSAVVKFKVRALGVDTITS